MERALAGFTIGITGHRRWDEQAELLTGHGARVRHGPVLETTLLSDASATLAATAEAVSAPIDVLVLTTGIGTRSWFAAAESAGLDGALRRRAHGALVLARGPKARNAALANDVEVHWQAPGETGVELLSHLAACEVAGKRVVVLLDGGDGLASEIAALGAQVVEVPVYTCRPPADRLPAVRLLEAAAACRLHAVTFTCAHAVDSAFGLASDPDGLRAALNGSVRAVSVGPVTSAALRRHGVERTVEPPRPRLGAMVKELVSAIAAEHRVLRHQRHTRRWQGDLVIGPHGEALLTPGEARVLAALVAQAPGVVAKQDLVDSVDGHAAEAAVARLRIKLGPLGSAIRTVPRRGYTSDLEVTPAP